MVVTRSSCNHETVMWDNLAFTLPVLNRNIFYGLFSRYAIDIDPCTLLMGSMQKCISCFLLDEHTAFICERLLMEIRDPKDDFDVGLEIMNAYADTDRGN